MKIGNNKSLRNLVVIIILLSFAAPCVALPLSPMDDPVIWPPIPGNMKGTDPVIDVGDITPLSNTPQVVPSVTMDVDIVDLITQINESLLLGYLENLTSYGPRVTGETGCEQAATYIYETFADMDLDVRYDYWDYGGYNSTNIEATLPGIDPTSDDIYIICGHYDTVEEAPGADDDASGVAAVLAAAQVMKTCQFNNTIRFVAFSGEEEGLYGSYTYVDEAYNNGDDIKGVLNVDMIGFALNESQGGSLNIFENDASEWLYEFTSMINQVYSQYIDLELIHSGWSWGSDHYYFWEYGYGALFYHEYEFNHYYHSADDTIQHMNLTYDVKGTRLILATLASLAQYNFSNSPPSMPILQGLHYGKINEELSFTIGPITDPDLDQIYFAVDWGDGSNVEWAGPYASGLVITISHAWSAAGWYEIRLKAKDTYGAVSPWSEPFIVYITSPMFLLGLVRNVNNTGEATFLTMSLGLQVQSSPFGIKVHSAAPLVLLNNESSGHVGSLFIIGQFYALFLYDLPTPGHFLWEDHKPLKTRQ